MVWAWALTNKSMGHTHILSYTCILIKSLSVCLSSPLFGGEEGPTQSGVRGPYTGPDFSVKRLAWIEWLIICQCIPWIKYIRYENASIKKIVQVVYFKIFLIKKCSKRVGYPGCQAISLRICLFSMWWWMFHWGKLM